MKISIACFGIFMASAVSGFQTAAPQKSITNGALNMAQMEDSEDGNSRRSVLKTAGAAVFGLSMQGLTANQASASLLDEFGTDPTKIKTAAPAPAAVVPAGVKKVESDFEPNLRSNYYYPTNKKRYLPRIKKCNDAIPEAAAMIGTEDWEGAAEFATKIADDTILPMKLYTSSLLGGGTNVKVSFAKDMNQAAADFEKAQKALVKAIAKKDRDKSSAALENLSAALQLYRTAGKLTGPDGGGDIPSVDEIRRSACRVQGRTFEKKIKDRDSRVKET